MYRSFRSAAIVLSSAFCSLLAGCALENTAAPSADLVPSPAIAGTVHGGSQPIFGAKVYLLAVNPTGYGGPGIAPSSSNASVSLLTSLAGSATPDSIGNYATTDNTAGGFSLSGAGVYSCTVGYAQGAPATTVTLSGSEQVYLYVSGGAQSTTANANTSSGLLVALGPCNTATAKVTINEITTAAMAYAFAGFASDATHIGSSGSTLALTGLNNAYANVANLAVVSTGASVDTYGTNIVRPTQGLITIADMLAACVNGVTNNGNCTTLFAWTKTEGASGTAATDTATAAIHLAHYPYPTSSGMTSLYGLVPSTGAPFVGGYGSQPNDFTLGLYLTSSGCFNNRANGIAIDASGSAWSLGLHGLCKFASNGTALTPNTGYTGGGYAGGGQNLAIDNSGNVWVPAINGNSNPILSKFSNSGGPISTSSGYTGGGISTPLDIAIDASGYVWIANQNGTLSKFDSGGGAVSGGSGYSDGGTLVAFYGVAINASGNVWAANYSNSSLSEFNSMGQPLSPKTGWGCCTQAAAGGLSNPYDIAIDPAGNVWASDHYYASLSKFTSGGAAISGAGGYQGNGSLSNPQGIAIDSMGKVWVANPTTDTVSVFTNSGTELSGDPAYNAGNNIYSPVSVAIDGSGNVWVADFNGALIELIGAGAPVVTPIVANLVSPYGSSTVYRP